MPRYDYIDRIIACWRSQNLIERWRSGDKGARNKIMEDLFKIYFKAAQEHCRRHAMIFGVKLGECAVELAAIAFYGGKIGEGKKGQSPELKGVFFEFESALKSESREWNDEHHLIKSFRIQFFRRCEDVVQKWREKELHGSIDEPTKPQEQEEATLGELIASNVPDHLEIFIKGEEEDRTRKMLKKFQDELQRPALREFLKAYLEVCEDYPGHPDKYISKKIMEKLNISREALDKRVYDLRKEAQKFLEKYRKNLTDKNVTY